MKTNEIIDEWFDDLKEATKNKTYALVDDGDIRQLKIKLRREE